MGYVRLFRVVSGTKKTSSKANKFFLQIIYDPFIFATDTFPKIQSTNFDGMALSVDLGPKCHIPLNPVLVHGLINYKDTKSKCRRWCLEVHLKSYLKRQIKGERLECSCQN
jgi:hypothetical protein